MKLLHSCGVHRSWDGVADGPACCPSRAAARSLVRQSLRKLMLQRLMPTLAKSDSGQPYIDRLWPNQLWPILVFQSVSLLYQKKKNNNKIKNKAWKNKQDGLAEGGPPESTLTTTPTPTPPEMEGGSQNKCARRARGEGVPSILGQSIFWPSCFGPGHFWPKPIWAKPFLAKINVSVVSQPVRPRRVGAPKGGGPRSGGCEGWGAKPRKSEGPDDPASGPLGLHTTARELQTCTFQGPGTSNTTKIPRKDTQERKKERNLRRESEKKTRNFGLPPFGAFAEATMAKKRSAPKVVWAKSGKKREPKVVWAKSGICRSLGSGVRTITMEDALRTLQQQVNAPMSQNAALEFSWFVSKTFHKVLQNCLEQSRPC